MKRCGSSHREVSHVDIERTLRIVAEDISLHGLKSENDVRGQEVDESFKTLDMKALEDGLINIGTLTYMPASASCATVSGPNVPPQVVE